MRERATLKLDTGDELRVELDRDDLEHDEIVVRRTQGFASSPASGGLLAVVDEHLAGAASHPSGTTDRLLEADRQRSY
ncbi:MAG: hypothetical protein M3417_06855 [Actinomycetota bacterium]|nr:hypothetical protein [Actinomycetota bacterium]